MFEDKTYQSILNEMLMNVPSTVDKREGSVVYDALAPAAYALARIYTELDGILDEAFADTASRFYLVKRAAERGLTPYAASYAVVLGKFDREVSAGTRFSGGLYNYTVIEREDGADDGYYYYRLQCETAGSAANAYMGALVPVDEADGLSYAAIESIIIPGRDEEDTEVFRQRYFDSFQNLAFGGNVAQYKEYAKELGAGAVKVYRAWQGGGTVMLKILDAEYKAPSEELIEQIQQEIDPVENGGEGVGMAPIGHRVTVLGADAVKVGIVLHEPVFNDGYTWEDVKASIEAAANDYFDELNTNWENTEHITVRTAEIEIRTLDTGYLTDVQAVGLTVGGETVSGNAVLNKSEIAVLGEVSVYESA